MENFITGYPGCEFQIREALENVLGEAKSNYFFNKVKWTWLTSKVVSGAEHRNSNSTVFGIFLRGQGRDLLQVPGVELHPYRN